MGFGAVTWCLRASKAGASVSWTQQGRCCRMRSSSAQWLAADGSQAIVERALGWVEMRLLQSETAVPASA